MRPRKDPHFMLRWEIHSRLVSPWWWHVKAVSVLLKGAHNKDGKRICLHSEMRWIKLNVKYSWTFTRAKEQQSHGDEKPALCGVNDGMAKARRSNKFKYGERKLVYIRAMHCDGSELCVCTRGKLKCHDDITHFMLTQNTIYSVSQEPFPQQRQKCTLAWLVVESFHFTKSSFMQK